MTPTPPKSGSAVDLLLGGDGEPPECKVVSEDVSMHWYPTGAKPGDKCLCGTTTMKEHK